MRNLESVKLCRSLIVAVVAHINLSQFPLKKPSLLRIFWSRLCLSKHSINVIIVISVGCIHNKYEFLYKYAEI